MSGNDGNAGTSFGAAWQTIDKARSVVAAGDETRICATGAYTLTTSVTLTASGSVAAGPILWTGANATGTVDGTQATITSATNGLQLFKTGSINLQVWQFLNFTHTAGTRGPAFQASNACQDYLFRNCTFDGVLRAVDGDFVISFSISGLTLTACWIKNCTDIGIYNGGAVATRLFGCVIDNCTNNAIRRGADNDSVILSRCRISNCGSHGFYDSLSRRGALSFEDCDFYQNGGSGVQIDNSTVWLEISNVNNIFTQNAAYGFSIGYNPFTGIINRNNFYYSNTSGPRLNLPVGTSDVTLTGNPYTNAGTGDFSLNNTAGAGAAVRTAGYPGLMPDGTTTGYLDGGVAQHQDSGGSAGMLYIPNLDGV